jgi:hypothetical protein
MVDRGSKNEVIAVILPLFDFLIVVDQDDMEKGVEYIRAKVLEEKSIKRCDKRIFEDYLDCYFKKIWLRKKLVEMFNYYNGNN